MGPNQTWIQPPGYVHQMIHQTWLPFALKVDAVGGSAPNATLSASAQISGDGSKLRILIANNGTASCTTNIVIDGWKKKASASANTTTTTLVMASNGDGDGNGAVDSSDGTAGLSDAADGS